MNIIADLHTHNGEICGHATGSLDEMLIYASKLGMEAFASTDHGPFMEGTPLSYYMNNLKRPKNIYGMRFLSGIEADIRDYDGTIEIQTADLLKLDWVIASIHGMNYTYGSLEENTNAYLSVLENPAVDCLGHIGRGNFPVDFEKVIRKIKEKGRTAEVNNHTFDFSDTDINRCRDIAFLCVKHELPIVITSDAHSTEAAGHFSNSIEFLKSISFPEQLIINADKDRLFSFLEKRKNEKTEFVKD